MLLDTHIILWILSGEDKKISKRASRALATPGARFFVSVVSIWEILLKRHAGKLWASESPEAIVSLIRSQAGWKILSLESEHLLALAGIAAFTDHADPFDRLLIAQASSEKLSIVSADAQFGRYGVKVTW